MREKDKQADRWRWRGTGSGHLIECEQHVPLRKLKFRRSTRTCKQAADCGRLNSTYCRAHGAKKSAVESFILILIATVCWLEQVDGALGIARIGAELPVPVSWSQPLEAADNGGAEWRPSLVPLDGEQFLRRLGQASNVNNITEAAVNQVMLQIIGEPIYLPANELLEQQHKQIESQRQSIGFEKLNQSSPTLATNDQVVAESSPSLRSNRRQERPGHRSKDFSIEQVIPVRRGQNPLEEAPREREDQLSHTPHDERSQSSESEPGERLHPTTPQRFAKEPAVQSSDRGGSIDITLVQSAAKRPPVYMSAPKHISELSEINKRANGATAVAQTGGPRESSDLNTAADHYKTKRKKGKKKKKKKVYKVKKYKKKRKSKKKKKKKMVVVVKKKKKKRKAKKSKPMLYKPLHHHHDDHHHHHHPKPKHEHYGGHHEHGGKYYEYRSVPKKGSWKFGYKRGNKKHTISRKEHGHKSHFKTKVEWKDKKGKGHHVFDYNHGDHHKHDHHHAASATKLKPAKAQLASKLEKSTPAKEK